MKNSILVSIVVLLLLLGGGFLYYKNTLKTQGPAPMVTAGPNPSPTVMKREGEIEVILSPVKDSQIPQAGRAVLYEENGKTVVEIALSVNKLPSPQPVHIHTGTCAKPGAVVYPLTNVVNGTSKTTLNVSLKDVLAKGTLINVHKSATESSVYTACGEIPGANVMIDDKMQEEATPSPTKVVVSPTGQSGK